MFLSSGVLMKNPKISVYIPSHNYGKYLEIAIESVLLQTTDNWELLIIDDNSKDNTPEIINMYKGDERIRTFFVPGIGLPAVCNLALRESKGKYIIRLDGDDFFEENILLVLSNYLERNAECAMVFPDYYLINEYGEIFAHEKREKIFVNNHVFDTPANGACSLIRKSVLQKIGGYREDIGAQDGFDLWNKLVGHYKIGNINLPLFFYRQHGKNLTQQSHHILSARRRIKSDNIIKKVEKYRPIIAVIPCRKNYDFYPDVWQRKLMGKTLLEINIEKCIQSRTFDYIVVASDNPDVKDILSQFDDHRLMYFTRKSEETIRSLNLTPTLERIVQTIDPECKGLTVLSYLQAPFFSIETLEESFCTLILNDADCAFGVEEIQDPVYKRTPLGFMTLNPSRGLSSDFDILYKESNISLSTKNTNILKGSLTGPQIVNFVVSPDECFFINSEQKLKIAEILLGQK